MKKKSILFMSLLLVITFLLFGCKPKKGPKSISDEVKIKTQIETWTAAWVTKDVNKFKTTMVESGIKFTYYGEIPEDEETGEQLWKTEMTIDEFITVAQSAEFWEVPSSVSSRIEIDSISVDGTVSIVNWKWIIEEGTFNLIISFEAELVKKNGNWLIKSVNIKEIKPVYEGDEDEEFDPERHKAYVSFEIDGKRYVFHDQYGAVDPNMTSIVTYNKEFCIEAFNRDTKNELILIFSYTGDHPSKEASKSLELSRVYWNNVEYDEITSCKVEWNKFFEGDIVEAEFSVKARNEAEEEIEIIDGFFYINHEFNLPKVTILNPTPNEGEEVGGVIEISGTAEDDSELLDVSVSIYIYQENRCEEILDREEAEGTENWYLTFDFSDYPDGEYLISVFARDEHYNYSPVAERKITINNPDK
ncbi:MAG TPA: hypothetical protein GXX33_09260 [Firmicutes bacterium]|nr:hypothetical protein [Bacillota bacterium]